MFDSLREKAAAGLDKVSNKAKEVAQDQATMSLEKAIDALDEAVRLIKARNLGYSISAHLALGPIALQLE